MIRRNITYFALMVLFFLFALYTSNTAFYIIAYTMLLLPISSLLHLLIILGRLRLEEQIDRTQVLRGEGIAYFAQVHNRDLIFYPDIKVNYDPASHFYKNLQDKQTFFVGPLGRYTIKKNLIGEHVGAFELGIQSVEISDFFGFFKFVRKNKNSDLKIIVMPRIAELTAFGGVSPNPGESFQSGAKGSLEDYSELEEIRKFTPGLPLKSVHWKLSAKRNELMARKFAVLQSRQISIYADVEAFRGDDELSLCQRDAMIETTLSIAKYCLYKGMPAVIRFNDPVFTSLKMESYRDFNLLYGKLFQMTEQHGLPLSNMLKLKIDQHINAKEVVVLTKSLDESLFDSLIQLKLSKKNLGFVYLNQDKASGAERLKGLRDYKIQTYEIGNADEIKEILEKSI